MELTHSCGHLILGKTPEQGARSGSTVDLSRGVPREVCELARLIQLFAVMLDYPFDASRVRQEQVRQLAQCIFETTRRRDPVMVCGDFNAGPDSDEIRLFTGCSATAAPGLVFYDAWEVAGDATPGHTWSNRNPLASAAMYPDRRFDYVLSAWPRLGAVGHPTHCELIGVVPPDALQMSDHCGIAADLRC